VIDLHVARVNREMVDLEPLDAEDADLLRMLVQRHVEHTGSAVGEALLDDWQDVGRTVHEDHAARLQERPHRAGRSAGSGLRRGQPRDSDAIMEASRG
jgi:glutamate synthase (NADPH/NADH) large chain